MSIFSIQVKTRDEEKYIKLFRVQNPDKSNVRTYFPKREIRVYKQGKVITKIAPVFAGYVFVELEKDDHILNHYRSLHITNGFFRFLPSNKKVHELRGSDLELVIHFIRQPGQVAGVSKVYFDKNEKIVVKEGPMLGLEGRIVKIDRRKGRAKIRLDLYGDTFSIDLAFEMIEPTSRKAVAKA
ncbi:MAG: antiterminator LoaP [Spirochaetaceae bacterium]|jgi:transcriptional antiterminator NusG|nr:antiterminator LoaP [Spirochaetaceae bacterium]